MQYRSFGRQDFRVSALGFGCMRLPLNGDAPEDIHESLAIRMLRHAIDQGVNYVDTAYPYHGGRSEVVVGKALREGYRQKVKLADKLPIWMVRKPTDVDRLLEEQLVRLGTDFIDVYLIHNLARSTWPLVRRHRVIQRLEKARDAGKIGLLGFSFHDGVELFRQIVDAYAGWDVAQIQYNYVNERVQAGTQGLRYGASKGLAMVVMEPLLGGCLVTPPPGVAAVFSKADARRTPADWALQWLWHKPEVSVVLSGMSTMEHVEKNLAGAGRSGVGAMLPAELGVMAAAAAEYKDALPIPCTTCRYCMPCPHGVDIPAAFSLYNGVKAFRGNQGLLNRLIYQGHLADNQAARCVRCGECVEKCPQKIDIIDWLPRVHAELMKTPAREA